MKTTTATKPRAPRKPAPAAKPKPPPSLWDVQRLVGAATSWAVARREVTGVGAWFGTDPLGRPVLWIGVTAWFGTGQPGDRTEVYFRECFALAVAQWSQPALCVRRVLTAALARAKREAAQRAASGPGNGKDGGK